MKCYNDILFVFQDSYFMLNTSVGKRVVRILLECCLVHTVSFLNSLTCNHLILFPFQHFCVEFDEWMDRTKVIQIFLQLNTYSCSGFKLFLDLSPWVEFKFRTNRFDLFITNLSECIATNVTIMLMHFSELLQMPDTLNFN